MNIDKLCRLGESLGCKILFDIQLKDYTTFKVGGRCPMLIEINSEDSLSQLVKFAKKNSIRTMVLGKGSNMLYDDEGFDGVIFFMGGDFSKITMLDEVTVEVEAGCSLIKLCQFALSKSLGGLEFAYGIPGTVGGAIFMNAGAYGGEIKDVIVGASAVNCDGELIQFDVDNLDLSYRHSKFQKDKSIVTRGVFKLYKSEKSKIESKMNELMGKRKDKQPLNYPNGGSTFKRPEGQFAGSLIQNCGLSGYSVGGAQVSEKHCGFVINNNNATSQDIKDLIVHIQKTVLEQTGFNLECEVRIIPYKEN